MSAIARRRVPLPVLVPAVVAVVVLALPIASIVQRAPWSDLPGLLGSGGDDGPLTALRLSLVASLSATAIAVVLGVPLAWVLARYPFPGRRLVRALVLLPMVLPPVVGGVALLGAFGRNGLLGRWLDSWFGIVLPFTTTGAAVAEAFVSMPFLVITAEAAFRNLDRRYEDAARTLGAGPLTVIARVVLPSTWPALVAGTVLAWARALGEFGATITFAGNTPGQTRTMPVAIFLAFQERPDQALALSLVLVVVSVVVLVSLRDRWFGVGPGPARRRTGP